MLKLLIIEQILFYLSTLKPKSDIGFLVFFFFFFTFERSPDKELRVFEIKVRQITTNANANNLKKSLLLQSFWIKLNFKNYLNEGTTIESKCLKRLRNFESMLFSLLLFFFDSDCLSFLKYWYKTRPTLKS